MDKDIRTDSVDSGAEEPLPPGVTDIPVPKKPNPLMKTFVPSPMVSPSSPGMLNAKKKLRAFSIQKKAMISSPVTVPKPITSGSTTVLIGKLSGVKVTPKPEPDPDVKKPPKPPKPGNNRKLFQENYTEIQKKKVAEIEDMKRKMELVELGIPLGLICPTSSSVQAMPTKAMPPIKSFLDPAKVDELIREAKQAKAEGKDFKFELSKFLPDYDNPFQRKKEKGDEEDDKKDSKESASKKDRWNHDRFEFKRHNDYRKKSDRSKFYSKDRKDSKDRKKDKSRDNKKDEFRKTEKANEKVEKNIKETDVNLNDYLVCDSWSLDTEDKTNSSSPKVVDKTAQETASIPLPDDLPKKDVEVIEKPKDSKATVNKPISVDSVNVPVKVEKLKPVMDSFKYELDSNEDEVLDIFDEDTEIDKYANPTIKKRRPYDSPVSLKLYDCDQEPTTADDENFLESVINEIKQEDMSDLSQDKGLVEYDMSPAKDEEIRRPDNRESVTPELDDRMRDLTSQQSSYSDGYRSSESGYKSKESGYKSDRSDSFRLSVEKDMDDSLERKVSKSTMESLETWSFILKICQPLLFRHDKNKCYKETHTTPKLWFAENPRRCSCVKDRAVVYRELETCKMALVDRVYGCDQIVEGPCPASQQWYPRQSSSLTEHSIPLTNEWENDEQADSVKDPRVNRRSDTPRNEEIYLDREYQRFMEAVWPEVSDSKPDTPPDTTPVRQSRKKKKEDDGEDKKKTKKIKLSSEGWSQESEVEEDDNKSKRVKDKERRKRKLSVTGTETDSDDERKRRKIGKKKANKKLKAKEAKRRRLSKKYLRKLKEKNKKKKKMAKEKSDAESDDEKEKKKEKKLKKKKQLKLKKAQKKKKARAKSSSSSSSSSESSSESSSDEKRKKKIEKKKKKEKKRKHSTDSTQSEELFDVNILKNIKTERETDDEKRMEFSPRRQGGKPREIINVKELQNDFVGNNIHIKQERQEMNEKVVTPEVQTPVKEPDVVEIKKINFKEPEPQPQQVAPPKTTPPPEPTPPEITAPEETSQCSSQESIVSSKDQYEKDDSHLRPSSQNSNYSFKDVMASHGYQKDEMDSREYQKDDISNQYQKGGEIKNSVYEKGDAISTLGYHQANEIATRDYQKEVADHGYRRDEVSNGGYQKEHDMEPHEYQKHEDYSPANYEVYEQLALAYQNDVASQSNSSMDFTQDVTWSDSHRIETVVGGRRGEIKCDWRAGDRPPDRDRPKLRPSRWGLKPGEVNIVLTRGEPVYRIQSIANRADHNTMSYDEAYMDMYGAADRLQYGDCFSDAAPAPATAPASHLAPAPAPTPADPRRSTLDDRIDLALKNTVLGDVAKDANEDDREAPEKGILVSKANATRAVKRVSFADGYTPGQDSDVEAPPKKKKKSRRYGCAWPCPASHPDHVPLWDALPPPPPPALPPAPPAAPPASPPPPAAPAPPPPALLAALRRPGVSGNLMADPMLQQQLAHHHQKFDPNSSLPPFMPPEPPPGMINFH
ncbi:trichohyalin isoform X3 [Amyelois transitella]|uniref:trichohyalin isoform X3 n=1 Tax=Amyelois transitella TaxID=680683 RepID=UPI00298F419B|nr:trichohyalin isoform X3 [Amyelois transitella]